MKKFIVTVERDQLDEDDEGVETRERISDDYEVEAADKAQAYEEGLDACLCHDLNRTVHGSGWENHRVVLVHEVQQ